MRHLLKGFLKVSSSAQGNARDERSFCATANSARVATGEKIWHTAALPENVLVSQKASTRKHPLSIFFSVLFMLEICRGAACFYLPSIFD